MGIENKYYLTVNILSFNRKELLRQNLTNLVKFNSVKLKIIVVDNGSTDGTVEMIQSNFPEVELIALESNIGISAWNYGFKELTTDYCLVLDDDTLISEKSLVDLLEFTFKNNCDIVYPKNINPITGTDFTIDCPFGIILFWGCCVLISKKIITSLKGFDKNIFIWEHELEFSIRALGRGFKIAHVSDIICYHFSGANSSKTVRNNKFNTQIRNHFYITAKFFTGWYKILIMINLIVKIILASIKNGYHFKLPKTLYKAYKLGKMNRVEIPFEIQKIYKDNYIFFVSPLYLKIKYSLRAKFYEDRKKYYP